MLSSQTFTQKIDQQRHVKFVHVKDRMAVKLQCLQCGKVTLKHLKLLISFHICQLLEGEVSATAHEDDAQERGASL